MSETSMEYNMDHRDELLLIDLRASLQADIARAMAELIQCKEVISNVKLGVNPYLHDAYCEVGTRVQELYANWYKWFPGEPAIKVIKMVDEVMQ
jgi:hypothetical protein